MKLVLSNDTQEHVHHRDDVKLKSGHFLPPIDCTVSTKQTKPRKGYSCFLCFLFLLSTVFFINAEVEHSNFHLPPINPKVSRITFSLKVFVFRIK